MLTCRPSATPVDISASGIIISPAESITTKHAMQFTPTPNPLPHSWRHFLYSWPPFALLCFALFRNDLYAWITFALLFVIDALAVFVSNRLRQCEKPQVIRIENGKIILEQYCFFYRKARIIDYPLEDYQSVISYIRNNFSEKGVLCTVLLPHEPQRKPLLLDITRPPCRHKNETERHAPTNAAALRIAVATASGLADDGFIGECADSALYLRATAGNHPDAGHV